MDDLIKTIGDAIIEASKQVAAMSPEGDLVKSLKDQIRTLTAENAELRKAKDKLAEDAAQAAATNISLRSCETNLKSAEKALTEKDAELAAYKKTCDDLNKMLQRRSDTNVRKLERDIEVYKMEIVDRDRKINTLRADLKRCSQQIRTLQGQVPQTKSQRELQAAYNKLQKQYRAACDQRDSFARTISSLNTRLQELQQTKAQVVPVLKVGGLNYTAEEVAKQRDYNIKLINELNAANAALKNKEYAYIGVSDSGVYKRFTKEEIQSLLSENRCLRESRPLVKVDGKYMTILQLEAMAADVKRLKETNAEQQRLMGQATQKIEAMKLQIEEARGRNARLSTAYDELKSQALIRVHNLDGELQIDGLDHRIPIRDILRQHSNATVLDHNSGRTVIDCPTDCVVCNVLDGDITVRFNNIEFPARIIPKMWEVWQNDQVHFLTVIDGVIYHYKDIVRLAEDNCRLSAENKDQKSEIAKLKNTTHIAQRILDGRERAHAVTQQAPLTSYMTTAIGTLPVTSDGMRALSDQLDKALAANKKALDGILAATEKLKESIT